MPVLTQSKRDVDFIISEASGTRSRDNIVVEAGAGLLKAGTVLGQKAANSKFVASPVAVTDGAENANAILCYAVDATAADVSVSAVTRDAEVNVNQLLYASDVDLDAEKTAKRSQLSAVGIVAR